MEHGPLRHLKTYPIASYIPKITSANSRRLQVMEDDPLRNLKTYPIATYVYLYLLPRLNNEVTILEKDLDKTQR